MKAVRLVAFLCVMAAQQSRADAQQLALLDHEEGAFLMRGEAVVISTNQVHRAPAVGLESTPLAKIPAVAMPDIKRPTVVAGSGATLAIYDEATQNINVFTGGTGNPTRLSASDLSVDSIALDAPASLLAAASSSTGEVLIWNLSAKEPPRRIKLTSQPRNVVFDAGELLFLDARTNDVMALATSGNPIGIPRTVIDQSVRPQLGRLDTFAVHRGILYIASDLGLAVLSRTRRDVLWLTATESGAALKGHVFSAVAASESSLVLLEGLTGLLRTLPRPVPIVARFEADDVTRREQAFIATHEEARKRGFLQFEEIEVKADKLPLGNTLRQVFAQPGSVQVIPSNTLLNYAASLVQVNGARTVTPGTTLAANSRATLPRLPVRVEETWRTVELSGTSVDTILRRNGVDLIDESVLRRYGQQLVDRNKPNTDGSLTSVLASRHITAVAGARDIQPGSIVEPDKNSVRIVGHLRDCQPGLEPPVITALDQGQFFELQAERGVLPAELAAPNADSARRALVNFEKASIKTVKPDLRALQSCKLLADRNRYVVVDTVHVTQGQMRFVTSDGAPVKGVSRGAASVMQGSRPDVSDSSVVRLDSDVMIGFSAARLSTDSQAIWFAGPNRAGNPLDELKQRNSGSVTLPFIAWEWPVLLFAADLESGLIKNLLNTHSGLYLYPTQRIRSRAAAELMSQVITPEELTKNRNDVLSQISFPPAALQRQPYTNLKIGLAEKLDSLNTNHEALRNISFLSDERPQENINCQFKAGDVLSADRFKSCHHGTFIATLLAGQSPAAPGLVPGATLCLINMSDDEVSLAASIARARQNQCRVINVSQVIEQTLTSLATKIEGEWTDVLFIGAANEQREVESGTELPRPLLRYQVNARGFEHILGVAPRGLDGGGFAGPALFTYGRFVQLAAVGDAVLSGAGSDAYVSARGSSIAVPQVVAAAAILDGQGQPARSIKARLIYTANWLGEPADEKSIWGGMLNFRRAIRTLDDLLVLPGSPNIELEIETLCPEAPRQVEVQKTACALGITGGKLHDFEPPRDELPEPYWMPFNRILRISRDDRPGTTYRVVFIKDGRMRMVEGARLLGSLHYKVKDTLDVTKPEATVVPAPSAELQHEWSELADYTARILAVREVKF